MLHNLIVLWVLGPALGTFILCQFASPLCGKLRLIDKPDSRKLHPVPTPLMGGLALLFVGLPALFLNLFANPAPENTNSLLLVLGLATAAMAIIGLADDRHDLTARDRLLTSFLVFLSVGVFDPRFVVRTLNFQTFGIEIGLINGPIALVCTMIFCVGFVNAVNMADGKNGLVTGLCLGWLTFLGTRAPASMLPPIVAFGSVVAILFLFNIRGRLFLGDGGAYGLATAIALITIATYNTPDVHSGRALYADEIVLLFAIPVFDAVRLVISRLSKGKSAMAADRDHLHHHLLARFGWPTGLVAYHFLALLIPISCIYLFKNSGA